jgi:hypothetical protein
MPTPDQDAWKGDMTMCHSSMSEISYPMYKASTCFDPGLGHIGQGWFVLGSKSRGWWECSGIPCSETIHHGILESPHYDSYYRRKIRLIEGNAKCHHLKKFTCNGTLRHVVISEAQNPISPPPLHTVYMYTIYLFTQAGVGGELNQREG